MRPLFWTIQGRDFWHSIRWAVTQPRLRDIIMKPKIIQRAQFAAGAGGHTEPASFGDKYGSPHSSTPIIHGAVIEIGTVRFESARPTSAANAEFINRVAEEACK